LQQSIDLVLINVRNVVNGLDIYNSLCIDKCEKRGQWCRHLQQLMAESVEHGYNNSVLLLGPRGCGKSMVSLSVQAASSFVGRKDKNSLNQRDLWVISIKQFA
jgi:predicted AAA+ superfamily ATPase